MATHSPPKERSNDAITKRLPTPQMPGRLQQPFVSSKTPETRTDHSGGSSQKSHLSPKPSMTRKRITQPQTNTMDRMAWVRAAGREEWVSLAAMQ